MVEIRKLKRILLVDDQLEIIEMAGKLLKAKGYQINIARNGRQALEVVSKTPPDLILSDVDMPEMNGLDLCRQLNGDPITREIPFIFLSGNTDPKEIVKGFEAGAVDYVSKPFNSRELLSRLDTHLSLRGAKVQLEELTDKVSRYLSPQLYDAIFAGEKGVSLGETHLRPLTVYFSDIVQFTKKTESMGDKDLTHWLNGYCDQMATICLKHGGTLDKFIGDAVMVFFGDPQSKGEKEDAIACLRMAIEMNQAADEWDVQIRTGINTGPCYVGNFGSARQMNYTVIGGVVNTAARLQGKSEPGKMLISAATYELVKDDFWCDEHGKVTVKGIEGEIMTYWVNG